MLKLTVHSGLQTAQGSMTVSGTVLHGRFPRLLACDGIDIEAPLDGTLLFIRNRDVPGVIGRDRHDPGRSLDQHCQFRAGPGRDHQRRRAAEMDGGRRWLWCMSMRSRKIRRCRRRSGSFGGTGCHQQRAAGKSEITRLRSISRKTLIISSEVSRSCRYMSTNAGSATSAWRRFRVSARRIRRFARDAAENWSG